MKLFKRSALFVAFFAITSLSLLYPSAAAKLSEAGSSKEKNEPMPAASASGGVRIQNPSEVRTEEFQAKFTREDTSTHYIKKITLSNMDKTTWLIKTLKISKSIQDCGFPEINFQTNKLDDEARLLKILAPFEFMYSLHLANEQQKEFMQRGIVFNSQDLYLGSEKEMILQSSFGGLGSK